MLKMKKIISFILVLTMLMAVFAGCSTSAENTESSGAESTGNAEQQETDEPNDKAEEPSGEEMPCRYVVPGTEPDDSDEVDAAITEKLKADGINMKFERIYIPWDAWDQKVNLKMSTGDEFELIHIMEDVASTSSYVAKGGLAPINEYLDEYGSTLKDIIPQEIWDAVSVDGQIYNIPVYYRDFAVMMSSVCFPKHLFEKYDLSTEPKDMYELMDSYAAIIEGEQDPDIRLWTKVNMTAEIGLLRNMDSYPFTVVDSMFFVSNDGEVKPYLETEEFKEACNIFRYGYEKGVIHPDILTYPHEKIAQLTEQGKNLGADLYALETIRKTVPEYEISMYTIAPEKPITSGAFPVMNANGVSSTSPNPEAGVIFFNWLYSDQANYNLLNFGIEGKHWNDLGDRRFEVITNEDGTSPYTFGDWEMGHKDLVKMAAAAPKELEKIVFEMDENIWVSNTLGFKFDPTNVSSEYSACIAEIQSSVFPLKYGVVSYEDGYQSMIDAMNTAGYQKVVEEFNTQFKAWQAENK